MAEFAAIAAFLVAVASLVVAVFFDTGISMPWSGEDSKSPAGQAESAASDLPEVTSTGEDVSAGKGLGVGSGGELFSEELLDLLDIGGLVLGAALAYVMIIVLSMLFAHLASRLGALDPRPAGLSIGTVVATVGYLWSAWRSLSGVGVVVFLSLAIVVSLIAFVMIDAFVD